MKRAVNHLAAPAAWLLSISLLWLMASTSSLLAADSTLAPTGTLRAVYLSANPAQAVRDPESGDIRGASADLARELGRRIGVPVVLTPSESPQTVIEAVNKGEADIGFVAYAPSRVGTVEFSQTYMLVQQSFVVADKSLIRKVADIDRQGQTIAGGRGDSITLFLARTLKRAKLVETDNTPAEAKRKLLTGEIDAFGANRQRLTNLLVEMPNFRILPDNIFDVPQTIIVKKGNAEALAAINRFIDEMRTSGRLRAFIGQSGVIGIDEAPEGYGYGQAAGR